MWRPRRAMVMATALCTTAFTARGQDGDVTAGHAFAREACKACHMVEAEENAPRMIAIGPAFRDIANTRGMTATVIRVCHELAPEDAKPDPHTGGDHGCERIYPEPPRIIPEQC